MKKSPLAVLAALALALATSPAHAAIIPDLFNTGTDATNTALEGGNGVEDPHYLIFASTSAGFAGNQAVTFVHALYAANDADSRWISLSSTGSPGSNTTTYRLEFDLSGLDPTTALITGHWGVDNTGEIFLNGLATGNILSVVTTANFTSLSPFSISSGFVAGINFLDFIVTDAGAPTALRVDNIAGTAALANGAIPEPGTWAMMLLGFGAVGVVIRRRRGSTPAIA